MRALGAGARVDGCVLAFPSSLTVPLRGRRRRPQQGAAGKADTCFRGSQLCITEQNIEGLVGGQQTILVTGPAGRINETWRTRPKGTGQR